MEFKSWGLGMQIVGFHEFVILLSLAQRHEMPTGNEFSVTLIDRSM
jgi:hypothetical protein